MDAIELERRLSFAVDLARGMGDQALAKQPRDRAQLKFKGHQDYLTEVDGAIERQIADALRGAFPEDAFLGEEGGGVAGRSIWVVDPIDGTANYARGGHFWCISIAHMTDGVPDIGVVHAPALRRLYAARNGGGATCNGTAIQATHIVRPSEAVIELDWTASLSRPDFLASLDRVLAAGFEFRRSGACALGLAQVAEGMIDGYAEIFTKPWDALAGCVLVREAGGRTNRFERDVIARMGNPIVAAGAGLYDALRTATEFDESGDAL
jgi:myo-inositol-1(or 4)-monophosphatase